MRISYLRRTDRRTDREKSALVELRFAAKKGAKMCFRPFKTYLFLGEKRGGPLFFAIVGPNFMNFEDFSKYFSILGGKRKKNFFAKSA